MKTYQIIEVECESGEIVWVVALVRRVKSGDSLTLYLKDLYEPFNWDRKITNAYRFNSQEEAEAQVEYLRRLEGREPKKITVVKEIEF